MRSAFLFSGQGAQKVGMGQELVEHSAAAREVFACAEDMSGIPVFRLCFEGPQDVLSDTRNTQVCLAATSLAAAVALQEHGVTPDAVAGFSLGEYAAHVVAKTIDMPTAFDLLKKRATYMADAAESLSGGMLVLLGITPEQAGEICETCGGRGVLEVANLNAPGQVVVSGTPEAIEQAKVLWKESKGRSLPVKTSGPFHSSMMEPSAALLAGDLAAVNFAPAAVPLYCNVTAAPLVAGDERDILRRQIVSPVRWEDTMRAMIADGVDTFIECGPGGVLTNMLKRIDPSVTLHKVENLETLQALVGE